MSLRALVKSSLPCFHAARGKWAYAAVPGGWRSGFMSRDAERKMVLSIAVKRETNIPVDQARQDALTHCRAFTLIPVFLLKRQKSSPTFYVWAGPWVYFSSRAKPTFQSSNFRAELRKLKVVQT